MVTPSLIRKRHVQITARQQRSEEAQEGRFRAQTAHADGHRAQRGADSTRASKEEVKAECADFRSNAGMEQAHDIDQRLIDLEIKASFTEDLVESLNQTVIRQQQQIDLLIREVTHLRNQGPDDGAPAFRSLRDELPPHY